MKQNTLGKTGLKVSAIAYGGVVSTMGHYGYYRYPGDGQQASNDYVEYAPLSSQERVLLDAHLPKVRGRLFMPAADR